MASEGAELDLYADDIGDEFSQENEYNDSDLYDDVITSNSKSRATSGGGGGGGGNANANTNAGGGAEETANYNGSSTQSQNSNHSNASLLPSHANSNDGMLREMRESIRDKKPCVYVGNLTWWTTDEDVIRALLSIGVNDVAEIKFFENRANGQSKGFCVVTLQSENSVRVALEKLPKIELHGQAVQATMCNRQNLNNFEMKSRKPGQNGQSNNPSGNGGNQNYMPNNRGGDRMDGIGGGGGGPGGRGNFGPNQGMQSGASVGRPPLLPRGPLGGRPNGPLLNSQPRLPQLPPHQSLQFGGNAQQQWSQLMQNGPRNPMHNSGGPQLNPMLRMPQGNRSLGNQPLLSAPANPGDLRVQLSSVGLSGVGQHPLGPSHANPLFASQQSLLSSSAAGDQFGNRFGGLNPYAAAALSVGDFGRSTMGLDLQNMGEAEFEEILAKNKNLANNAVSRAVADAASGDYNAAMDTLATAISLISQSRVSHDDRCKIIVSSLKDTLQGIEAKSYSSGGRKERPRSRERSRERGSSRRDKSRRSRSREYRERSRERDRHYDDRHYDDRDRYKESDRRDHHRSDRERDHRSSRH